MKKKSQSKIIKNSPFWLISLVQTTRIINNFFLNTFSIFLDIFSPYPIPRSFSFSVNFSPCKGRKIRLRSNNFLADQWGLNEKPMRGAKAVKMLSYFGVWLTRGNILDPPPPFSSPFLSHLSHPPPTSLPVQFLSILTPKRDRVPPFFFAFPLSTRTMNLPNGSLYHALMSDAYRVSRFDAVSELSAPSFKVFRVSSTLWWRPSLWILSSSLLFFINEVAYYRRINSFRNRICSKYANYIGMYKSHNLI